jgi:hypothetical protein
LKIHKGDLINEEVRRNILILHSYHQPVEEYARDVALEIAKNAPEFIIVKESPRNRIFECLSRKYKAGWILDLHSSNPEVEPHVPDVHETPYRPLGKICYGERWPKGGPSVASVTIPHFGYTEGLTPESKEVRRILKEFEKKYYPPPFAEVYIGPIARPHSVNPRFLIVGLLWYRPLEISIEFVKKLCNHLYSYPL